MTEEQLGIQHLAQRYFGIQAQGWLAICPQWLGEGRRQDKDTMNNTRGLEAPSFRPWLMEHQTLVAPPVHPPHTDFELCLVGPSGYLLVHNLWVNYTGLGTEWHCRYKRPKGVSNTSQCFLSNTHTPSNPEFSILPKDASACRLKQPGIKPPAFQLVYNLVYLLSQRHPNGIWLKFLFGGALTR